MVKLHDRVGPHGRHARVLARRVAARRASIRRCSRSSSATAPRSSRSTATQLVVGHVYIERRMPPLNLLPARTRRPGATPRARRCASTATRSRSSPGRHLPRRHAAQELRRHAPRPGRVLRLRRDPADGRHALPPHPAAAERRGGDVGGALVSSSGRATSSPSSSSASSSASRARARSSTSTTATSSTGGSGARSRRRCAPASRRMSFPTRGRASSLLGIGSCCSLRYSQPLTMR